MEFDKTKVYTALNADESLIGAKGYFDDDLARLRDQVVNEFTRDLKEFKEIEHDYYIKSVNSTHIYNFFYLVEPAPIYYVLQDKVSGLYSMPSTWAVPSVTSQCVFSGSLEECNNYITEHSKKYRPFKDCDELISYFCQKHSISKTNWGLPFIWVKDKTYENRCLVTEIYRNAVSIGSYNKTTHLSELFEDYTFLDDSPCGVEC